MGRLGFVQGHSRGAWATLWAVTLALFITDVVEGGGLGGGLEGGGWGLVVRSDDAQCLSVFTHGQPKPKPAQGSTLAKH